MPMAQGPIPCATRSFFSDRTSDRVPRLLRAFRPTKGVSSTGSPLSLTERRIARGIPPIPSAGSETHQEARTRGSVRPPRRSNCRPYLPSMLRRARHDARGCVVTRGLSILLSGRGDATGLRSRCDRSFLRRYPARVVSHHHAIHSWTIPPVPGVAATRPMRRGRTPDPRALARSAYRAGSGRSALPSDRSSGELCGWLQPGAQRQHDPRGYRRRRREAGCTLAERCRAGKAVHAPGSALVGRRGASCYRGRFPGCP